ncbi:NmrA family NAD(P)-binding protein [Streptomyces lunaelactis]|uniref:NmrA family NAD(P)-binding protein n=1 Tax=Streptomyces lunaelactis TaxID=1535768 RepID=UPI001C30174A|nr:NmrA family NAD(P)-binding protein [Streptomyces lunaelactis]
MTSMTHDGPEIADGVDTHGLTHHAAVIDPVGRAAHALASAGAEIVTGDLDDRASLDAAVKGAYGVFSVQQGGLGVQPVGFEDEVRRGRSVTDAALAGGVEHLVYTSVAGAERSAGVRAFESKWEIEERIRAIGIPATILRPASFMENVADPAFGLQTGQLATAFAPDVAEQLIAVEDIGTFVALAFGDPTQYLGKARRDRRRCPHTLPDGRGPHPGNGPSHPLRPHTGRGCPCGERGLCRVLRSGRPGEDRAEEHLRIRLRRRSDASRPRAGPDWECGDRCTSWRGGCAQPGRLP